jgi:hypothetical protein
MPNANADANGYSRGNGYANCHSNSNCDFNTNGDAYTYTHTDANTATGARCSVRPKSYECDCQQFHRQLEKRSPCDRLSVRCLQRQFLWHLLTGLSKPGCRQYD